MLFAIAIVAILAAMLFPALGSWKNSTYSAGCAKNLRQLMVSVHRYVGEHDGYMPWIATSNGTLSEVGYAAGDGIGTHSVNVALGVEGYFDDNPQMLQCPGWRNWKRYGANHGGGKMVLPINTANGGSRSSIRNTYEWRNLRPVDYNPPSGLWATVPRVKMARINEPSREWYIADSAPGKNYQAKTTTYSHGNGGFAAFVDGHVGWLTTNPQQWTMNEPWVNLPRDTPGQFTRY